MADEANRTGGLFLPYPLLGILMTLVLALGGGIIGLYVKVDTLSTTILLNDANYQRERQQNWEKLEQLQVYINNDREKIIRLEEQQNKQRTRQ